MGFGSRRPTRVPLLNARHWAACFAWAREHRDWSVEDRKRVVWSDEYRFHPDLNPIEHLWDILEQGVKGRHTVPTNLTELCAAFANFGKSFPWNISRNLLNLCLVVCQSLVRPEAA
ncbi:transposable element Tc1 transposase [Trichonephila clavipes]|nr:transposable element Tc1 transposase [Trichonephila clavipes]